MTVQRFDDKQQPFTINGLHLSINRNEKTVVDDEGSAKYEYDVEAFDVNKEEDIDNEVEAHVLFLLHEYDKSSKVNCFYLNSMPLWLDKDTRVGLLLRFQAEKAAGKSETTLWIGSTSIPLSIDNGIQMLYALEVYASECYDNTAKHEENIKLLAASEDKVNYDITVGYPTKLQF